MTPDVIEQPATEIVDPVAPETQTDEQLPVRQHAAKFSEAGRQKEAEALANETSEQKTARQELAAQQKRDRETGQFDKGKNRHRAKSQQATPEDAPRIKALTGERNDAVARAERAEKELATLRANGAPRADVARAEAKVEAATEAVAVQSEFKEPEPQEGDEKFAGDYGKYLRAVSAWEGRKAYHEERAAERQRTEQAEKAKAHAETMKSLAGRMEAATTRYPDFEAVAYAKPAPWLLPNGSAIPQGIALDAYIRDHKAGPDVLYYFQLDQNRPELGSLLAKPMIEQLDHLALLSQRLLPESASPDGVTRSSAGRNTKITLPPKPPNLVRTTEAQRTTGGPPPTDGTLGVSAHAKQWRSRS